MTFSSNIMLRDWLAQEFRLAMQQESECKGALERAGVADIRAARVLSHLDGINVGNLAKVPQDVIEHAVNALIATSG